MNIRSSVATDIGLSVAAKLLDQAQAVKATAHFDAGVAALESAGIMRLAANFDYQEEILDLSLSGCRLFYLLAPQGGGSSDYRMLKFCRTLFAGNCPNKISYISTSGVITVIVVTR